MNNNANLALYFNENKFNVYKNRVYGSCVFLALLLGLIIFLGFNVIRKIEVTPISYTDTGTVDYRVHLKENEFYSDEFLPKGQAYATGLIDYIDITYNYLFNIDVISNINFEYQVMADLIIEDNSVKKVLLKKPYEIVATQKKEIRGTNELVLNEKFQINYSYYNQLANKFRSSYGVDTNSYLKIYMNIKKETTNEEDYSLKDSSKDININEVVIPLSERAIEINIDSKNNKTTYQVTFDKSDKINYTNIAVIGLLFIMSLYVSRILYVSYKKMNRRRSEYDRYVNKLLKEYDRLIVETGTLIDFRKYNVIQVSEFNELLDVRDNLKVPINYYCLSKHINGLFYVKADDDIYALYISSELLEKNK